MKESKLLRFLKRIEPDKQKHPFLHTVYDGMFTFFYTPNEVTAMQGVQIRDRIDLKRTMIFVVLSLQLAYLLGTYNIGHQHFSALGQYTGLWEGWHLKLVYGLIKLVPLFVVSYVVGLGIEFFMASRKGHPIAEGYLVTGALIPLIMPPDMPLWILALSIVFAVWIGKEAFGGTGMNVFNIALLARAFVFFAYPQSISGDEVWISGIEKVGMAYQGMEYGWIHHLFDSLFRSLGWAEFGSGGSAVADAFTGATPLALAAKGGWEAVTQVPQYSLSNMWWGFIPGSIGETSKPLILAGALFLLVTGIANWRIMVSMFLGAAFMGWIFNLWGATPFMDVPWQYQFFMGGFFFAMAFMATDPVTAAGTNTGKWVYGFLIGVLGMFIRVVNVAYPEGWMLAILFMNAAAPLIDHVVKQSNIRWRKARN